MKTEKIIECLSCEAKIDSLSSATQDKIDSLEKIINNYSISEAYFHDIISHQWTLYGIQTALFAFIISLIVSIALYFSWRFYFRELNKKVRTFEDFFNKMPDIIEKVNEVENRSARALYELHTNLLWKVIWHIRYIEWFADTINEAKEQKKINDIIARCKVLKKEYEKLKSDEKHYNGFKKFANKGGLKKILIKVINLEISEITPIAAEILSDLQGE